MHERVVCWYVPSCSAHKMELFSLAKQQNVLYCFHKKNLEEYEEIS
jgi:hypothetical protein